MQTLGRKQLTEWAKLIYREDWGQEDLIPEEHFHTWQHLLETITIKNQWKTIIQQCQHNPEVRKATTIYYWSSLLAYAEPKPLQMTAPVSKSQVPMTPQQTKAVQGPNSTAQDRRQESAEDWSNSLS